jgi:phospholipid/cholesterol/gamma-HCH transport system substrate-binding protein
MDNRRLSFFVGLASIIGLIGLAVLLFRFGELEGVLRSSYPLEVRTDEAAGLRPGSPVTLRGVRVGSVERIEVDDHPEYPVRILSSIDQDQRIPGSADTVTFRIEQSLIGGTAALNLRGGAAPGSLATDGTARLRGTFRSTLDELAGRLEDRLAPLVDAAEAFAGLAEAYGALGIHLTDLLAPQAQADLEGGAPANLRTVVDRLNGLIGEADAAVAEARSWLQDGTLRADARSTVQGAARLMEKASTTMDRYAALADSLEGDARRFVQEITRVGDELAGTLEEVRVLTRAAKSGDGTVAQLLSNPDLYNALTDAAVRLERALVEFQLLVAKLKSEGVKVGF